jgi:hypothetical protein
MVYFVVAKSGKYYTLGIASRAGVSCIIVKIPILRLINLQMLVQQMFGLQMFGL